jgi:hypothetical protein
MVIFAPDCKFSEIYAARRCDHNPSGCEWPFIAPHRFGIYKLPLVAFLEAEMRILTWLISLFA